MDVSFARYCISLLLLTSMRTSAGSDGRDDEQFSDESREARVSGRIVKLYSGVKPQPYICAAEGFQPDLANCAIFYRCVKETSGKFTVFRYQCAPGTVYDTDLETCNHPRNTRRAECGGMLKPSAEPTHAVNLTETPVAQSEVPRPISTKIPIYTKQSTFQPPTTPTWVHSTITTSTKTEWDTTTYNSPSAFVPSSEETFKQTGFIATNPWSSINQVETTAPPKIIQQTQVQNDDRCTSDGFMGDSENCRKFYRCVDNHKGGFVRYEFSCSELTVWDDEIQGCNHPWAVKRSKCGRSLYYDEKLASKSPHSTSTEKLTEGLTTTANAYGYKFNKTIQQQLQISHGSEVTQTQTQISNNDQMLQNQTQVHYGDKKKNNNNFIMKQNQTQIGYGNAVSQTQTQLDYGNKGVQTQLQIDHSKDTSHYQMQVHETTTVKFNSYEQNSNKNHFDQCSQSGFMGDSNDCKKFYRCVDNGRGSYTKFEYFCGDGTVWDPEVEACNHVWAVKHCGGKGPSETTTVKPSNTITTTEKLTVSQTKPTKTTQIYYTTSNMLDTDEDENGYGNQNNHETTSSSTITMKTTTTINKSDGTGPLTECTSSGFMGDSNDCKKFYRCVDNGQGGYTKFEYSCGEGTVWDPNIEACNHAWAVKQCEGKITSLSTSGDHTSAFNTTTSTKRTTAYDTDPTKTTQIDTSIQVSNLPSEGNDGYGFQNNQETASPFTTSTSASFGKPNATDTECTSSGFIGDQNDCKVFYRCVDNGNGAYTKYEFKCGDGTLWDPNIEACNHAWAVKNCGGGKPINDEKVETTTKQEYITPAYNMQTTVSFIQITNQSPTQHNEYDTGYGSQNSVTSTKPPQEQENHKDCKSSGFVGDDEDCKKFYRCVDDGNGRYTRYEFTCGEGTVWDPKIEACNHEWAVERCGGSNSVVGDTETSSQGFLTTNNGHTNSMSTTQSSKNTDKPTSTSTTSTTSSSSISNECSNTGFIGDNSNCKIFYRCVDNGDGTYTRYEFTCGEGTVWDPKIEACNHAWAVEACAASSDQANHGIQQTSTPQVPMKDEEIHNGYPSYETSVKPQASTTTTLGNETIPSENIYCSKPGFMSDKKDCKKFYRCVDNGTGGYNRYEYNCGEGTLWDESIEACNHAWAVKNCGRSTTERENESTSKSTTISADGHHSTDGSYTVSQVNQENELSGWECNEEGFFGDKYDCIKFYRCVDNGQSGFNKYEFFCGEGTFWSQSIQSCDHASDGLCALQTQKPTLNDDMDNQTVSSLKPTTLASTVKTDSTLATKRPESSQNACVSEGFYGDPSDCKKFYRCVTDGNGEYTKYDFSCGDGTVWNQESLTCDHESADNTCKSGSSSQTQLTVSQSESTTNSYSTTKKQESTNNTETSEPVGSKCTSDGFYAHPHDCKKFIRCVSDGSGGYTRYEFSCGDGTVWVQDIQACDHVYDSNTCRAQNDSNSKPQNNEEHPSTVSNSNFISSTEGMTPNKEHDEYDPGTGMGKEPSHDETGNCKSEGYFANNQDCRKFYRCVDNSNNVYKKYDFSCGDGTAWDPNLQTCNHIDQVQSCSHVNQENGNYETTTNKNSGETNNSTSTTQTTTTASLESSSSNSNNKDECENEGYFGYTKNCKMFYRCVDNGKGGYTKYDFTCGDGTIWDQDITNCNHPGDVSNPSCTSEQSSSDTTPTTSAASSSSSQTTSSTTENSSSNQGTSDGSQEPSKESQNKNITCEKAGYYANPNDCKKFYRCVDWDGDGKRFSVFHFECGEGTIWDPALDTCNYEDSVYPPRDCSQSQSQNVGGDSSTTEESTTTTSTAQSSTSEQTTQESSSISTTEQLTTTEQTTTQQTATSEQTTTEQSTNEQTTTQPPTTSEKSTTQESATTEQTQTTTSEKTTTLESTTSEQTQKTTINDKTTATESTTEQSTENNKTTTQESSTSNETTTQESSTSNETTSQEPTTSGQATTEELTTSEPTTTQQSENTTNQQSTTTEQTSTQQSTTETPSEQFTTAESTTSEQTTSEQSSTTDDTTQGTTTSENSTTQQSTTTDQTTTQEPASEQTTEKSTTEPTAEETATSEATTESTTEDQSTTHTSTAENQSTTESSASDKECPETKDDQYLLVCPTSFRRHPKYCNMFYQCMEDEDTYEAKVAMFKCPNNTIYDENQTQCVAEDKADKKCDGEIANKRRFKRLNFNYKDPIVADEGKQSCSSVGYFAFEKQSECSKGFLKCEKSKNGLTSGYVYQCPDGFIYWSISKRCEREENVRDCKRSFNDWTGRWSIPIERKNIATS